jgi:hypothetical protein
MTASKSPRAKAFAGLKALAGPRASPADETTELFHFLKRESVGPYDDRAIALVTASVVEQGLESALLKKFIPLGNEDERSLFSDDGAPLSDFDSKTRLAFALGIIGPAARADLSCMRKIRNAFAHSRLDINFVTEQVVAACAFLTLPDRFFTGEWTVGSARERYVYTGYRYSVALVTYGTKPGPVSAFIKDTLS